MKRLPTHVLAAYYSDARLNILACLNEIRSRSGLNPIHDDGQTLVAFSSLKLSSSPPEEQAKLIKQLRFHFRFLDPLTDPKHNKKEKSKKEKSKKPVELNILPEDYEKIMTTLLRFVHDFRNTTVHAADEEKTISIHRLNKLHSYLVTIYNASKGTVGQRFSIPSDKMNKLNRCDHKAKERSISHFPLALCRPINDKHSSHCLSSFLHDFGQVILCSMFLDKSQGAELLSHFWQTKTGKRCEHLDKALISEIPSVYRTWLPMRRLYSDETPTAVTIDALSELTRCPGKLFDSLSPEKQELFRAAPSQEHFNNQFESQNAPKLLFTRGHQNRHIPLIMRFMDFLPNSKIQFAIDLGHFYYDVRYKPPSNFTDGVPRVRRVGQKLITYGKLIDFETLKKPEYWDSLENSKPEPPTLEALPTDQITRLSPYIVSAHPHHHFYDDKIGFRIAKSNESTKYPAINQPSESTPLQPSPLSGREMAPDFWASPTQLMHIAFYTYLSSVTNNTSKKVNNLDILLTRYRAGMVRIINEVANGGPSLKEPPNSSKRREEAQCWIDQIMRNNQGQDFSVHLSAMPKVLIQHLKGLEPKNVKKSHILDRIKQIESENKKLKSRLDFIKTAQKKRGQKKFEPIKCGQIGDFLAEDFLRFQPIDQSKSDGGKLNSQQYQILQATLAYYGAHLNEPPNILNLLEDTGLLSGQFQHPFLYKLDLHRNIHKYQGLVEFYNAYLKERSIFLADYKNTVKQQEHGHDTPGWLRLRQHSSIESWLKEYRDSEGNIDIGSQPLPIPKNMLFNLIMQQVASITDTSYEALLQEGTQEIPQKTSPPCQAPPAVSWLIKKLIQQLSDNSQEMYGYNRADELFDSFLDERTGEDKFNAKKINYLSENQRKDELIKINRLLEELKNKLTKKDNNKDSKTTKETIKRYEDDPEISKWSTKKRLFLVKERRIRHTATWDILLYLFGKQHFGKVFSNGAIPKLKALESDLLNTAINYDLAVEGTNVELFNPQLKVRNVGELRLLVRDKHLPSLLRYYPKDERRINQLEIRSELLAYRRTKVRAMQLIAKFELALVEKLGPVAGLEKTITIDNIEFGGRHGQYLYSLYNTYKDGTFNQHLSPNKLESIMSKQCFENGRFYRNAFSHDTYPDADRCPQVVVAVNNTPVPDNPTIHRKVSERILSEMESIYKPWTNLLRSL